MILICQDGVLLVAEPEPAQSLFKPCVHRASELRLKLVFAALCEPNGTRLCRLRWQQGGVAAESYAVTAGNFLKCIKTRENMVQGESSEKRPNDDGEKADESEETVEAGGKAL